MSTAPGLGQPRPHRRGEARGLHVYEFDETHLRVHTYTWRDGEDLLFDETYIHTAENLTNETRIILFCDVERPLKTRFMTNFNRWVIHHVVKATTTQNVDGEKVGAINKAFVFIYPITLVGKRMKAWNRKAYYALKYALGAALLAAILITSGQALLLAVDTSSATETTAAPSRYDTTLGAKNIAEAQRATGESRNLTGG